MFKCNARTTLNCSSRCTSIRAAAGSEPCISPGKRSWGACTWPGIHQDVILASPRPKGRDSLMLYKPRRATYAAGEREHGVLGSFCPSKAREAGRTSFSPTCVMRVEMAQRPQLALVAPADSAVEPLPCLRSICPSSSSPSGSDGSWMLGRSARLGSARLGSARLRPATYAKPSLTLRDPSLLLLLIDGPSNPGIA